MDGSGAYGLAASAAVSTGLTQINEIDNQLVHSNDHIKETISKLTTQLDFLFSNSNLHKDKFLQQYVFAIPARNVPLNVLSTFHKIASISRDVKVIKEAVAASEMVQLCDDGEGVQRRIPAAQLPPNYFDDYTVYVENLPTHTSHDLLKEYFSPFGEVTHISLPRFSKSRNFKGFAFVEFSHKSAAEAAVIGHRHLQTEKLLSGGVEHPEGRKDRVSGGMLVMHKSEWKEAKKLVKCQSSSSARPTKSSLSDMMGTLLRVEGIPTGDDTVSFAKLKAAVSVPARPAYVDCPQLFEHGRASAPTTVTVSAIVRYRTAADAQKALQYFQAVANPPCVLAQSRLTASVITGDAEVAYLKEVCAKQQSYQLRKPVAAASTSSCGTKRRRADAALFLATRTDTAYPDSMLEKAARADKDTAYPDNASEKASCADKDMAYPDNVLEKGEEDAEQAEAPTTKRMRRDTDR